MVDGRSETKRRYSELSLSRTPSKTQVTRKLSEILTLKGSKVYVLGKQIWRSHTNETTHSFENHVSTPIPSYVHTYIYTQRRTCLVTSHHQDLRDKVNGLFITKFHQSTFLFLVSRSDLVSSRLFKSGITKDNPPDYRIDGKSFNKVTFLH